MKRTSLITRILLSLIALALFTSVAAAQTKSAKSSKMAKADSTM